MKRYSHNPYFNRWFSAINNLYNIYYHHNVTILILIDGFLQYNEVTYGLPFVRKSQSLF